MARSLVLVLALAASSAAQQYSLTLAQPASTICAVTNFTWTFAGFSGLQIPATNVSLGLVPVAGENSTVPLVTTTGTSGTSTSHSTTSILHVASTPPTVAPVSTSRSSTTPTRSSSSSSSSSVTVPPAVVLTTVATSVLEPSTTTLTVNGAPITVTLEVEAPTNIVVTVTPGVAHGRRLNRRASPATMILIAPLSADYVSFDPSTVSPGWYLLTAQTISSLSTLPVAVNLTSPFYVTSFCPSSSSGLSTGAKAGIAVGVILAALAVLACVVFFLRKRRSHKRASSSADWAHGGNPDVFQSQWRRSLGRDRPNGANGNGNAEWEFEKGQQSVPLSPMAGGAGGGYRREDPFEEKEDERLAGMGTGTTSRTTVSVSRQSSVAEHAQPLQPQSFPTVPHPYNPHPYNPYLYNPGTQPQPQPALAHPSPALTGTTHASRESQEPWARDLPSFFESASTSPRESGTTQGRISRDRDSRGARGGTETSEEYPPSAFQPRKVSGPTPVARVRTQSSETSRPSGDLLLPPQQQQGTPPDNNNNAGWGEFGQPLQKSPSVSTTSRGGTGPAHRRKPVPQYDAGGGGGGGTYLPSPAPSQTFPSRLSLPTPTSPFLSAPDAGESKTSLDVPPGGDTGTRKSSLSVSGAGVDPGLGMGKEMHVLIPDMPAGYEGRQ